MIKRLDDKVELYKLHVKHCRMSPTQFRRRTSMLNLPDGIYEKYEEVYEPQFSGVSFLLIIVKSN